MVNFEHVFYIYNPKSPVEFEALHDVSLTIEKGDFVALVGRTGSGKSTLVQHINALMKPTQGKVVVNGYENSPKLKHKGKEIMDLRKNVGLVFQFPENQLFEETVEKDVAFAPKNFGMNEKDALEKAHEALRKVGLNESFFKRSPFELSGGEKRRVAIAGVLAFHPSVLIVDEPTAGLDPEGTKAMMALFKEVHEEGTTVILVTHDMNLVHAYCQKVIVMEAGRIAKITDPLSLFAENLESYSLETPLLYRLGLALKKKGLDIDLAKIRNMDDLASAVVEARGNAR